MRIPLAALVALGLLLAACSADSAGQTGGASTPGDAGVTPAVGAPDGPSPATPGPIPQALSGINDFLYQLQDLDLAAVGAGRYDLVIMDYSDDGTGSGEYTTEEIQSLKNSSGGPKVLLAYMSIGEAEDYRFYWREEWDETPPAWLDAVNPDWLGNYKVRYLDEAWQGLIFGYTGRLIDAGFDGAYLDIIDAYQYYQERGDETAAAKMASFVADIRAHARNWIQVS